jgi:hypothetical protein
MSNSAQIRQPKKSTSPFNGMYGAKYAGDQLRILWIFLKLNNF